MKLDQSSMEKLLYLILMMVKKELFLASSPLEIYTLTLGNMRTLQQYAKGTPSDDLLEVNINHFSQVATNYTFVEYLDLKDYLLTLLENYQTKVINFHEGGHQNQQGKLTFVRRNRHNQLDLGDCQRHPRIQLALFSPAKTTTHLPLSSWVHWNTSLVMDHVSEYEKQSERRKLNSEGQMV